ncbi:MAG: CDP-diacylglycerol--glycerol-3-phosphate 3-phosphatidyltransferase [bacterium]|nr:CDP-diacylglycerol--glycerol-3-phosphate 3-phosphatidyltransferase [Myxococcales bacterium]MCB9550734.1 CDP-diacylglycerol--glycerol-3-phosphate 3-phosphatidyltransferase [Myxococcales bacterium]
MKATLRAEFVNLPNILTYIRVAAIPLVMLLIWRGAPRDCVVAAWVYSFATITDFFDGWLARRMGLVTVIGKFLDPLADKLMVMGMLVMLVALNRVPGWLVVLILAREMTINGLRAIASSEGLVIPAGQAGKYKTALQMIAVMFLVVHFPYTVWFFGLYPLTVDFHVVGMWVLGGSVWFSMVSAVVYFRDFFRALDDRRGSEAR